MGLDIYAGTLTRYYSHNWKTVVQQWAEENGYTFNRIMTNVLTAFSCQRTFVIFYLLNSDITGGVVHNYAFSCIHRHIRCR